MKKYISLLLVAIMLLSSFAILTSCGGGEEETPAPETPVDRYTVTEEEWLANMEAYNYTVSCKNINTENLAQNLPFIIVNLNSLITSGIEILINIEITLIGVNLKELSALVVAVYHLFINAINSGLGHLKIQGAVGIGCSVHCP